MRLSPDTRPGSQADAKFRAPSSGTAPSPLERRTGKPVGPAHMSLPQAVDAATANSTRTPSDKITLTDAVAAAYENITNPALRIDPANDTSGADIHPRFTRRLPRTVADVLDDAAVEDGVFDQPEERSNSARTRINRRRKLRAAAAATMAGTATLLSGCAVDGLSGDGDHPQPGGHDLLLDIGADGFGPDNMIFAEDLQAYELPDALKQQIGEALVTDLQIHAGPDQPLSHHNISGIIVTGSDGTPHILTINPAQGEYTYYMDGAIVQPDYQGGAAILSADGVDTSHTINLAEGLPSSTDVLHLVTYHEGEVIFEEVIFGHDEGSLLPMLFVPPQLEQSTGEYNAEELRFPTDRGGFVVNDKGELVGIFANPKVVYHQTGTDQSDPVFLPSLAGDFYPVRDIHDPQL